MYYEIDGTPTEWNTCCKCGKSAQFARFSVLRYHAPDRQPIDPVDDFCREHYPAGIDAFDAQQAESILASSRSFANARKTLDLASL